MFLNPELEEAPGVEMGSYYPKGDPNHDEEHTQAILRLKGCNAGALDFFYNLIDPLLDRDFTITAVPSSSAITRDYVELVPRHLSGIRRLARRLAAAQGMNRTDGVWCLVRHTRVEPNHRGGERNVERHLNSIRVEDVEYVQGRQVLLLDDVRTTGNSIEACSQLLRQAGAARVSFLILGQTRRTVP